MSKDKWKDEPRPTTDKDMPEFERRLIALLGGDEPRNEEEKKIKAGFEKIIKEGGIPEIPFN